MPVQRKVFRIEEQGRVTPPADVAEAPLRHHECMAELKELRALVEPRVSVRREQMERARAQIAEAQAYKHELDLIYTAVRRTREETASRHVGVSGQALIGRAGRELDAMVAGTEQATQTILQAAEDIGERARALANTPQDSDAGSLTQDLQNRVVQIYEACSVHYITGQRAAKVHEALAFIEQHIARLMQIWHNIEEFKPIVIDGEGDAGIPLVNGPKLPGENGHSTQDEIDALFGRA